jgi:hypothetical protein
LSDIIPYLKSSKVHSQHGEKSPPHRRKWLCRLPRPRTISPHWSFSRGIVRSQSKAQQVLADFPNLGSQLDFGIVPDITSPGAFDEVVKSNPPFDIVIHTASPFLYRVISSNREFLDPAIKGTLEVLKSVSVHAPSVKRVVITSSCVAVIDFSAPPVVPRKLYTEEDWNPTTWEAALSGTQSTGYQASKKFAEPSGIHAPSSSRKLKRIADYLAA